MVADEKPPRPLATRYSRSRSSPPPAVTTRTGSATAALRDEHDGRMPRQVPAFPGLRGRRAAAAVIGVLARPQQPPFTAFGRREERLGDARQRQIEAEIHQHEPVV